MLKHFSKIKKNKTAKNSMIFVVLFTFTNLLNLFFNIYLGKNLRIEDFGVVALVVSIFYFANMIFLALSATISHIVSYLSAEKKNEIAINFYKTSRKKFFLLALLFSIFWIILTPGLSKFFNIENCLPLILFTPIFSLGTIATINKGFLNGEIKFAKVGFIFFTESASKLLLAILLVAIGIGEWAYIAIPVSVLIAFLVSTIITKKEIKIEKKIEIEKISNNYPVSFPKKFFAAATLSKLSIMAFLGLDFMLIKHFFNPEEAGYYALLSLVGKIVFFMGDTLNTFTVPLIGKDIGKGKNPQETFLLILFSVSLITILSAIVFGILGKYTAPFIFGEKALVIVPLLPAFAFAIAGFTISNCIVTYHLAKKQYSFSIVSIFSAILTALGIVLYHSSLTQVVSVISTVSIINLISIVTLHLLKKDRKRFFVKQ